MAEKFVLVPHSKYQNITSSRNLSKGESGAPPPGVPLNDEIIKSMEIVKGEPERLSNAKNLAYVNAESVRRGEREFMGDDDEDDTSDYLGGDKRDNMGKVWSSTWQSI